VSDTNMRLFSQRTLWVVVGIVAGGGAALGLVRFGASARAAQTAQAAPAPTVIGEVPNKEAWNDCKYQNAATCSRCHIQPGPADLPPRGGANQPFALQNALMTEYSIWKTYDKHAQAFAVLEGPRGKMMEKLLGQDVKKAETGCINCHAMGNLAGAADAGGLDRLDGVSCGGCHGPSTKWFLEHIQPAWRNVTPEEKFKKGLRDLRDPVVKSELCMSCHIGNAEEGKVVTHAMFAAGHPPLPPIEIATFTRNQPQHWRDPRDVPMFKDAKPDFLAKFHAEDKEFARTKLAVVGSVVALRETLKLAASRSQLTTSQPNAIWPELYMDKEDKPAGDKTADRVKALWPEIAMAHSDCYACHHDLKYPGFRQQRGFGYFVPAHGFYGVRPGRPLVRLWPIAALAATATFGAESGKLDELDSHLKALAAACNNRPFGSISEINKVSNELVTWSDQMIKQLNDPKRTKYTKDSVLALMHNLCQLYENQPKNSDGRLYTPDYETAKQIASVLNVAYEDWTAAGGKAEEVAPLLAAVSKKLDLQPYIRRGDRLKLVFQMIGKFVGRDVSGAEKSFSAYLKNIGDMMQLEAISRDGDLAGVMRINNIDFNKGILDNIEKLQDYSDEEEKVVLESISNYDPRSFLEDLRKIDKALPKK